MISQHTFLFVKVIVKTGVLCKLWHDDAEYPILDYLGLSCLWHSAWAKYSCRQTTHTAPDLRLLSGLLCLRKWMVYYWQPEFSEQRYSCSSDTVTQKRAHLISSRLVEFREEICAAVTIRSILEDAEIILSVLLCVQGNISPSLDMQEKERNSYC